MADACDLSAIEARCQIGLKRLLPSELLESCLARIAKTNVAVNAIVRRFRTPSYSSRRSTAR